MATRFAWRVICRLQKWASGKVWAREKGELCKAEEEGGIKAVRALMLWEGMLSVDEQKSIN